MYSKLRHYCHRTEFYQLTTKYVQSCGQNGNLSRQQSIWQIDLVAYLTAYLKKKKTRRNYNSDYNSKMQVKFMIMINQICVMTWQQSRNGITMFCYCKSFITRKGLVTLMLSKNTYDVSMLSWQIQNAVPFYRLFLHALEFNILRKES